jgi:hypothetical protein
MAHRNARLIVNGRRLIVRRVAGTPRVMQTPGGGTQTRDTMLHDSHPFLSAYGVS